MVSCLVCALCMHMHGTGALNIYMVCVSKYGVSKYVSGLACTQADSNLGKITTPHFQVLNAQNANKNMPIMLPIAYVNENLMDCNENLAWVNKDPSFNPTNFGTQHKVRKQWKLHFTLSSCRYLTIKSFHIIFIFEYQHTTPVEHC